MHKLLLTMAFAAGATALIGGTALAGKSSNALTTGQTVQHNTPQTTQTQPTPKTYQVQSGDNLSTIAQQQNLDSWRPLWNVNPQITDPNLIYAGQNLVVPTGTTADRPLPTDTTSLPTRTYAPSGGQLYSDDATTSSVTRQTANYAAGSPGLMARVRQRESGGNYAEITGNGFYGAYQFTIGTWESVGGTGLPSNASPAEQDMRAQILYNERGCSPWPNTCY